MDEQQGRGADEAELLSRGVRLVYRPDGTARLVCRVTGKFLFDLDARGLHFPCRGCRQPGAEPLLHMLPWSLLRRADTRVHRGPRVPTEEDGDGGD